MGGERRGEAGSLRRRLTRVAPFIVVALVVLAALLIEPDFFSATNLRHVARQAAFLGVVALGQLLVVIVRGLDLSVGAVITATLLLIVELAGTAGGSLAVALLAVVAMAVAIGTLNALLVVVRRVPPILTTLAMFVLVQGVGLWLTGGQSRGRVPELIRPLGTGLVGPIPVPVLVAAAIAVGVALLLGRSALGRQMYAVGANPDASGTVAGTLVAVVGLAALDNLLLLAGVGPSVQLIAKGVVLFLAVLSAGWLFTRPGDRIPDTPHQAVLEMAAPPRPLQITYDRRESAFARLDPDAVPWEDLLTPDACLYLTGITPPLGSGPRNALDEALRVARDAGAWVALDVNYRSGLWPRVEADEWLASVLPVVDVLSAGADDLRGAGLHGSDPLAQAVERVGVKAAFTTSKEQTGTTIEIGLRVCTPDGEHRATARAEVADPIGAGDALFGTLLACLPAGDLADAAEQALGAAVTCYGVIGDALIADPWDPNETRGVIR